MSLPPFDQIYGRRQTAKHCKRELISSSGRYSLYCPPLTSSTFISSGFNSFVNKVLTLCCIHEDPHFTVPKLSKLLPDVQASLYTMYISRKCKVAFLISSCLYSPGSLLYVRPFDTGTGYMCIFEASSIAQKDIPR